MDERVDIYNSNISVVLAILHQFLDSNNVSIPDEDLTSEQILDYLQLAGIITEPQKAVSTDDLKSYKEYRIHTIMAMYMPPVILFLGTVGNVMSFLILRHKTMNRMSTNTFLAALSVADSFVLLIGLFRNWLGEITQIDLQTESRLLCKLITVLGYSTSQYSVWLIVAVTVERYIVVCHPLRASYFCNIPRARKVVCLLALLFLTINIHLLWTVDLNEEIYNDHVVYKCEGALSHGRLVNDIWPWIDALLYSFSPTLIIVMLNIMIIRQVIKATYGRDELQNGSLMKSESRRCTKDGNTKLTVMLLTISFTFLITTIPMNIVMIVTRVWQEDFKYDAALLAKCWLVRTIAELLMYLNHSINFFLYCATGQKFRNIVFRMVCRRSNSNTSNVSDHSQHIYCSRTNVNACSHKSVNETAL
ncbi:thyrotropin-releasing hormone receptor-like [Ylistrum balloti]|uniref:thyrotropin-releasing hormone receptor-like n=1 Tax=Ylistrum balloti TaxID=509963 RepID=UPI002905A6D9|nr:thyrotropin-releasing hormone receptor-like [Ylistrum balloti]